MKKYRLFNILETIIIMALILSFSIAVPVFFRPFYYLHINMLGLPDQTGLSYQQIKTAYDEMMDFCCGLTDRFATGDLQYSQEGMEHFIDVKKLFILDLVILIVSIIAFVILRIIKKKVLKVEKTTLLHTNGYYASTVLAALFIAIVLFSLGNFDRTFVIFHKVFFPGKSNWIFDPYRDEIINILPEVFFRNCAIVIVALIIICFIICIYRDYKQRKNNH